MENIEEVKEILGFIRTAFVHIKDRIDMLKDKDVEINLTVGTNTKTVNFKDVDLLEMSIQAKVNQEL